MFGLHNLSPAPGSRKIAKRVGRGLNGGAMCGRGNSGQNSRSGPSPCRGFEGGQTPLWQRFPKLGRLVDRSPRLLPVSLEQIQHLLLIGRIDAGLRRGIVEQSAVFHAIRASCSQGLMGIKVVTDSNGDGARWFDHRLCIIAGGFSKEAISRIEELGGLAISVYHSPPSFRTLVRSSDGHDSISGHFEPPMDYVNRVWYSSHQERGYLNAAVQKSFKETAPGIFSKYYIVPPMDSIRLPPLPKYS